MAAALTYQCDPQRGYDLAVHPTATYGSLKQLVIGGLQVAPDLVAAGTVQRPLGTQVCGILTALTWSSMPTDPITMSVLISAANRQQLAAVNTGGTAAVVVAFSVAVQQYETGTATYFPALQTRSGSAPGGFRRPAGVQIAADAVYGTVRLTGGSPSIQLGGTPVGGLPGAPVFQMELTVSSVAAPHPQQFQVQSSTVQKAIQPWGLPQS